MKMWSNSLSKLASKFIKRYSSKVAPKEVITDTTPSELQKFKIGEKYHGFKVKSIEHVPEFRVCALSLLHEATGAEYLHLFRDDSNNVFAVSFRTTPMDSTGAPHILEHTVLCGSKLYPVRDPFFKMLNRSLATFMNAMTGPDYTFYPFSTQNETDFRNLQKIYLDAVFRPNLSMLDFMQEGWRFENVDLNDMNSTVAIKGVVYNEMKGALAENDHILGYKTLNTLLPDHTYGYISGGDPFVIPNLTWEHLKEFHRDHYHPSNARFYSYGNFPLAPSLEYITTEYLSKYTKIGTAHTEVPSQSRWTSPKRIHIDCRYENLGQPLEKQNSLSISFLMSDILDVYSTFALQFASELLIRGPNSPLYKSLVEPKISGGFTPGTGFDNQIRDTIFTLGLQGLKVDQFEDIIQIFDRTIEEVTLEGFDPEHIESVLHQYELGIKHQSSNFGLNLLFGLIPLWNHSGDVLKALHVNSMIDKLKEDMSKDPKYLQNLIKKYFKENSHRVVVTMSPDVNYEKKYKEIEENLLKERQNALTAEMKKEIYQKGLELKEEQNKKQDLSVLPTLQIGDIKSDVVRDDIKNVLCGPVPTQICRVNTNGVVYFHGVLSTAELTPEQTMMLPLFCYVINKLGTDTLDYLQFDKLVNKKTAGLNFSLHIGESLHQLHTHEPGIHISSYCLEKNVGDMWNLWTQLFSLNELKDVKRFEMLVQLYMANLTHGVVDFGHVYAMSAAAGLVSGSSYQKDQLTGLQHIAYMKNLVNTSNYGAMLQELAKIGRILFDKNKMRCALNASHETVDPVYTSYSKFIQDLPGAPGPKPPQQNTFVTPKIWAPIDSVHCLHHVLLVPVYYCSKAILTVPYTNPHNASLRVLARLLSSKYLHPELREKNGAYGGGARLTNDGVFTFYSYRDPRHLPTLDTFDRSSQWLKEEFKKLTPQDVLEAKLGVFQAVDAPISPGNRGLAEFMRGLNGDILQRHRAEVMSVDVKELEEVTQAYFGEKPGVLEGKVVLGPKSKDLNVRKRKDELWTVMNAE